ncbi:helix-turn-helix domain-containing protein [Bacteroides mediterraneensis]|uniref:helix-turn-helix domain-containing protein n=1 Tax=Bacteroides mediterraneensis TaxID=1841856 RepID=UPI00195A5D2F|nr:helix-turn-helix domain-containing protein [Bacteroides mediterraneensis]MBM6781462.1 helix-turn-helix domain-containing protein [Bacteroides mediterraneensis]
MGQEMITVPQSEWDEMKKQIKEIQQKVETLYSRETDYVSISELCDWLNISRTTLWRLRSEGKIKTYLVGGKMVANKDEIQTLLNEGKI